ncbi:MAG: hypothetical protein IKX92_00875, partial [Clostridia bacterium]|nr:hypothetical protein [Clostridia bacterium]
MKRSIAIIVALLMVSVLGVAFANAEIWSDTESVAEDGNYSYGNAYGFDFRIDKVNGVIGGEDATVITNADAYSVCNPNWAISIVLENVATDTYKVVRDPIVTPGSAANAAVEWTDDTVVMVVHSSTSSKAQAESHEPPYTNWQQKVVAMALKVGDIITFSGIDLTKDGALDPAGKAHVEEAAEPDTPAEPEMETITVDGDLSDNGWAEDGWTEVSVANGKGAIQGKPVGTDEQDKPDRPFKIQIRTDEENIYVAVVMETEYTAGNADGRSGTNFRIWFHVDDEYDRYTHFYDVWGDGEGNTYTAAKKNTAKDANSGAAIEGSQVKGVLKAEDGKVIVEMSIPMSEFVPEGMTRIPYFANTMDTYEDSQGKAENVGMFYPAIVYEEGDPYMPWTAWNAEVQGIIDLEETALGEIEVGGGDTSEEPVPSGDGDDYEEEIKANMGPENDDPKF